MWSYLFEEGRVSFAGLLEQEDQEESKVMLVDFLWRFGVVELNSLASRGGLVSHIDCNIASLLINKERVYSKLVHQCSHVL